MVDADEKATAINLPNIFKRYEGTMIKATATVGKSGETQMFRTSKDGIMDGGVMFLRPDQVKT